MTRYIGLDPSTKTGLVILDKHGEIIDTMEITEEGTDPGRMVNIIESVMEQVEPGDIVAIEGFGFSSQSGFILGGIGWGIRMDLHREEIKYIEVAPAALKKFAGGKGNAKKDELAVHIFKRWGFEHKSDNVRDAFVLAHIARVTDLYLRSVQPLGIDITLTSFQKEVLNVILNPPKKKQA